MSRRVRDHVKPAIRDTSGYRVRNRDLRFLQIDRVHVQDWQRGSRLLGISQIQYQAFLEALAKALVTDGIDIADCDIRIQGSSSQFFSSPAKTLPRTRKELIRVFVDLRERTPDFWELEEIDARLAVWLTDENNPHQRPFDSMYRLGMATEPSDIDLQISSDVIVDKVYAVLQERGAEPDEAWVHHQHYDFVKKPLLQAACEELWLFSQRFSEALQRGVSIALFRSAGPADHSGEPGAISSHFKPTDWVIHLPEAQP